MVNLSKLSSLIDGKKFTKAQICRCTGLSRTALDAILAGSDFKVSNLEKLANALNVKIAYFFDEEEVTEIRASGRDYVEKGKIEHKGTEYNTPVSSSSEADLRGQIAQLKSQLADKERIIKLMEEKR